MFLLNSCPGILNICCFFSSVEHTPCGAHNIGSSKRKSFSLSCKWTKNLSFSMHTVRREMCIEKQGENTGFPYYRLLRKFYGIIPKSCIFIHQIHKSWVHLYLVLLWRHLANITSCVGQTFETRWVAFQVISIHFWGLF